MTTASITLKTRMLIQDTGQPFMAQLTADGVTSIFDLPVESVSAVNPLNVYLNGVLQPPSATPSWTMTYKYGVLQFSSPPPAGTLISVSGTNYDFFDDDEVAEAVTDAFNLHTDDQEPMYFIDPLPGQQALPQVEEILVALLAAKELLWFRATDASQEIDIHTPEGVSIPRSERYRQLLEQINELGHEYEKYSLALGVGLFRIQILWLRRVSYTTNRLVPLYREQEYNSPYTGFEPTAAPVGNLVTIYGRYFTGATSVTFGGVPAQTFTVLSDTIVTAVVPPGAQTGQIGVITQNGVVLSTAQFVVGQPAPDILYGPEVIFPPIPPGI